MDHYDDLNQQLWEFVYGLLSEQDGESLRGRIRSDPAVARTYVRVKQQSELVAQAARAEAPTIALPKPAAAGDALARSARSNLWVMRVANGLTALAATALICLMGYGLLQSRVAPQPAANQPVERILAQVSVPDVVRPDAQNWFFVQTTHPDGTPSTGPVYYRFYDARRDLKLDGQVITNAEGWGQFALAPSSARSVNWLEVAAGQPVAVTVEAPLAQSSADKLAYLNLDKKTYLPGETVHFRSVALTELDLIADQEVTAEFDVLGPNGRSVLPAPQQFRTQRGIAGGSYTLPLDAVSGQFTVALRNPEGQFSTSQRSFTVQRPRDLNVEMQLARQRSDYAAVVVSQVQVNRANGEPAAGARLEANAVVGGKELAEAATLTAADERGLAEFRMALPVTLSDAKGVLNVRVQDGNREALLSRELPPPAPDVAVDFLPEGGSLVPGIDNRLYFTGRDILGQPIDLSGRVLDNNGQEVARAQSLRAGQGVFQFIPETTQNYALAIDEPPNVAARPALPPVSHADSASLRIEPATVDADEPLGVQLGVTRADACVLVAAYCRGAMVGQQLIDKNRFTRTGNAYTCRFELFLAVEATGAIRVAAFDCTSRPSRAIAERLAFRYPRPRLQLHVEQPPASDVPEDVCRLRITVTDEAARPIPAVLSVGIVGGDMPAEEESGPTMAAHYYLATELDRPEEIGDGLQYLATDAEARTALELLLGMQRLQRFSSASRESALLAQSAGSYRRDGSIHKSLSWAGAAGAPTVYDNRAELNRLLARAVPAPPEPSLDRKRLGQVLLLGGAMLAFAAVLLALFRLAEQAAYLLPVFATAGASLLIGLMWLRADHDALGRVAQALPAATESNVSSQEAGDALGAAGIELPSEQRFKQLGDTRLAEEAVPSSEPSAALRASAPAPGEEVAYGESLQMSPELAPMAAEAADKPESFARGRAESTRALEVGDALLAQDARGDEGRAAGRAMSTRRGTERFFGGGAVEGPELPAGIDSGSAASLESAAKASQPIKEMGSPPMMSGGYGGSAPSSPPPAALAASALAMEPAAGRPPAPDPAPAAAPARGLLARSVPETTLPEIELARESVSEHVATTLYWQTLLVADENGQTTIDVPRGRTQKLRIAIDAHAAGRLGSLRTTLPALDPPQTR